MQTAISAKKGLADVVMLEADRLSSFSIQNALVDLAPYGADEVKGNFSEGAWKDVSQGDKVFAIPVDGGPMGMIYRTDVFEKYKITPPATWDEYAATAQKLKDAGGPHFGDSGSNVPALYMALLQQKGAVPFGYDPAKPQDLTIKLNDQASKDVLNYWADLVKRDLVGTQDHFTTDYISGVVGGKYATYVSAAWTPGYLTGAGVGKGSSKGVWAAAPLPQWDPANPVSVNWGGSAFAVTTQAPNKRLAAIVAKGMYADPKSLEEGWKKQIIFPLSKTVQDSPDFVNNESEFFNGQTANKDVYIPAGNAYKGTVYAPIQVYYYAQFEAAAGQDQRRQDDRRPGGRRPAGRDRQVRQGPGLQRHRVARGRFALITRPARRPPVEPPGRASPKGVRGCLTPQPSTRHRRPASRRPERPRPGGAASTNGRSPGPDCSSSPPSPWSSSRS